MKIISKAILTAAILAVSAPALASGGYGASGASNSGAAKKDPAKVAYDRGKRAFKKYVTCKKCAYSAGVNDSATAKKVAAQIRDKSIAVKPRYKDDLLYYISRRYRIRA